MVALSTPPQVQRVVRQRALSLGGPSWPWKTAAAFALHPVPTSADVLAILDRVVRRMPRRLADEACDDRWEGIDVLAQVQRSGLPSLLSTPTSAGRGGLARR